MIDQYPFRRSYKLLLASCPEYLLSWSGFPLPRLTALFACVVGEFVEEGEPVKLPLFSLGFSVGDSFLLNGL
jgi:hypothetical protein